LPPSSTGEHTILAGDSFLQISKLYSGVGLQEVAHWIIRRRKREAF